MTEDILQETYLRALISLKDSHTNFRAWLYMVARNLCFNIMKKNLRTVSMSEEIENITHFSKTDLLHEIILDEEKNALWNALRKLSDKKREVILLQYFAGFDQRKIAAVLQITPENVRILSYRAKKELKKLLGGERKL